MTLICNYFKNPYYLKALQLSVLPKNAETFREIMIQ